MTNQQGIRQYGGATGTTEYGNVGYADVTFGDAAGKLTTTQMPVFLYYAVADTATSELRAPETQQGWFGVNSMPDRIEVPGSIEPASAYPLCSQISEGSCVVLSVFEYLTYAPGVNAGFLLTPAGTFQICEIDDGSCIPISMLTVGLSTELETGFTVFNLVRIDPAGIYPACQATIPGTTLTVTSADSAPVTIVEPVLFDSGNPAMLINQPTTGSLPTSLPMGTTVIVAPPYGQSSAFSFDYAADASATTQTSVIENGTSGIGIDFFTTNSFFIDISAGTEGWKQ